MEQQSAARGTERQVAEFIENNEIDVDEAACDLTSPSLSLFLLESIDQLDGGEEAGTLPVMLDGCTPSAVAMCVLPVPGPPTSTTLSVGSIKSHR